MAQVQARAAEILADVSYDLAARLADQAEYTACKISELPGKARTLAQLAASTVRYDTSRAARLAVQAEQFASGLPDGPEKRDALYEVATAVAISNPSHAEELAAQAERANGRGRVLKQRARSARVTTCSAISSARPPRAGAPGAGRSR